MKIKGKFIIENQRTKEHIFIDNFGLYPEDNTSEGAASFIFNPNIYPIINSWITQDIYAGTFISKYDLVFDINIYDITGCMDGDEDYVKWDLDRPCIEIKNAYISSLSELQCSLTYDWYFIHYENFISKDVENTKLNTMYKPYQPKLNIPVDNSLEVDFTLDYWDDDLI